MALSIKTLEKAAILKEAERESYGALLLCAGRGTRLKELTGDAIPKPLYKIAGKELARYGIEMLEEHADSIVIVSKHLHEQIEQWVSKNTFGPATISIEMQGTSFGDAISEGIELVKRKNVIICDGDEIIRNFNFRDMIDYHEKSGSLITVLATDPINAVGQGLLLKVEGNKVTEIVKRDGADESGLLAHAGVIILNHDALQRIDLKVSTKMPVMEGGLEASILNAYVDRNAVIFNVNSPDEVRKATKYLLRGMIG